MKPFIRYCQKELSAGSCIMDHLLFDIFILQGESVRSTAAIFNFATLNSYG